MAERRHTYSPFLWNALMIAAFAVLLGMFLIGTPKCSDDWWFMVPLRGWFDAGGIAVPEGGGDFIHAGFPFREILDAWHERYSTDNARLGNMAVSVFLAGPKWLGSGIALAAWVYVMCAGLRMAGIDLHRSPLVPVYLALLGLLMPWRDQMGSMVYQFNYILANALCVLTLCLMPLCGKAGLRLAGLFVCSLLAGAWQETVSVPVLAGLCAFLTLRDFRRSPALWTAIAGMVCGVIWIIANPAHLERLSEAGSSPVGTDRLVKAVAYTAPYWIFLSMSVSVKAIRRKILRDPFLIFAVTSGFVPFLISLAVAGDSRLGWWSDFISVTGIVYVMRIGFKSFGTGYSPKTVLLSIPLFVLMSIHWMAVDFYVFEIRKSYLGGIADCEWSGRDWTFARVIGRGDMPSICLGVPGPGIFTYGAFGPGLYYSSGVRPHNVGFVPEELRRAETSAGVPLEGNLGARRIGDYIFYPAGGECGTNKACPYTVGTDRGNIGKLGWKVAFTSETDGRRYYYVHLFIGGIEAHGSHVTSLEGVHGN